MTTTTTTTTPERVTIQRQVTIPATFEAQVRETLAELDSYEAQIMARLEKVCRTLTLEYKVASAFIADEPRELWEERVGWSELFTRFCRLAQAFSDVVDGHADFATIDWADDVRREAGLRIAEEFGGNFDDIPRHVIRDLVAIELGRRNLPEEERFELLRSEDAQRALLAGLLAERHDAS